MDNSEKILEIMVDMAEDIKILSTDFKHALDDISKNTKYRENAQQKIYRRFQKFSIIFGSVSVTLIVTKMFTFFMAMIGG